MNNDSAPVWSVWNIHLVLSYCSSVHLTHTWKYRLGCFPSQQEHTLPLQLHSSANSGGFLVFNGQTPICLRVDLTHSPLGASTKDPISGSGSELIPGGMSLFQWVNGLDHNSLSQRLSGLDMAEQSVAEEYAASHSIRNAFFDVFNVSICRLQKLWETSYECKIRIFQ